MKNVTTLVPPRVSTTCFAAATPPIGESHTSDVALVDRHRLFVTGAGRSAATVVGKVKR